MSRTVRTAGRLLAALGLVATLSVAGWLGLVGLPGPLSAPPAAAAEPCVAVVVDARLLGGDVRTGCANGDPDHGLEALTMAGFQYAFVPRQPGLVCQVDGVPACDRTSTTTYWSYWYRAKGSTDWVYSSTGAGAHDPEPGSTEAWVWQEGGRREPPDVGLRTICPQAGSEPSKAPTAARPKQPKSPATSPSPVQPSDGVSDPTATGSPGGRTSETASRSADPSTPATTAPASTAPVTSAVPSAGSTSPVAAGAGPGTGPGGAGTSAGSEDGGGGSASWLGLAAGAGLVAALGSAAVVRYRRAGRP